jgi:hypothetical protein
VLQKRLYGSIYVVGSPDSYYVRGNNVHYTAEQFADFRRLLLEISKNLDDALRSFPEGWEEVKK